EKKAEAEVLIENAKVIKAEAETVKQQAENDAKNKKEIAKKELESAQIEKKKIIDDAKKKESEKKQELQNRENDVKAREEVCTQREAIIEKTEHEQAKVQNALDKRKNDADFGFQTELREERVKFDREIEGLKGEIADLGKKLIEGKAHIDDELKEYKENGLKTINDELQNERNGITSEREAVKSEKAEAARKKAELETELQAVKTSKEAYERKYSEIDTLVAQRVSEEYQNVLDDRDSFRDRCNDLAKETAEKTRNIIALTARLKEANGNEIEALKAEIEALKTRIEELTSDENSFVGKLKEHNVDSATLIQSLYKLDEYDNLLNEYGKIVKEKQDLELRLKEARVNEEATELESRRANQYQTNYENAVAELERLKKPSRKDRLSSFTSFTDFDSLISLSSYGANLGEISWLKNIKDKMEAAGIKISDKLLYAFHTSVKIHDWSPLVVLAGVSGTGKSELPRQYAHHGGMNFISIPVKPDWDSMQSLFGYYNSIENKFEPTELSRAIYYMQSAQMQDTILMVLLDEMNLAYVELYFSDLLSKYETNRGTDEVITYEISLGANEAPEKMEIGKNVLWVGTMNEDETTKALSDKVVDRSTLLTFPRPRTLVSRSADIKIADTEKKLPLKVWERWCTSILTEDDVKSIIQIDDYRRIIEEINDQMSKVNRNLGHRVWQSIELYVFSHPMTIANKDNGVEFKRQFDLAFAEAVAFKVMPKLRGIEVSGDSKKVLETIGSIIDRDVHSLHDDFKQAMSLSSRIFQWCSAKFMDVDEERSE
ncbi:MAG: hypothetical protein K6G85_06005, partial [Eubacterium sp.]|nr:hypothetical protein [Eubacterium sp.]